MEESPHAAPTPPGSHARADAAPPANRPRVTDRVTSGKRRFLRGDGRSREARRWIALHDGYRAALPGSPTAVQDALLKSLASTSLAIEQIAATQAQGAAVDPERLVALGNLQSRLLDRLGLSPAPEPKDDGPRLADLLRQDRRP